MTKKSIFLIVCAAALLGLYVYYFTDWFASEDIQIVHTIRPHQVSRRARAPQTQRNYVVSFGLNRKYKLTSIKVIPLADLQTNKYPHAIWQLVSDTNSVPIKAFTYGENIPGMHSAVAGVQPDALEPNVAYKLLLEAGPIKGEHEFKTPSTNAPAGS